MTDQIRDENSIAIIGMAGRFPGAKNIDELWQLLQQGRDAITRLTDVELEAAGVSAALIASPNYVKICLRLDGYDLFDAGFFGYSPRQAISLDPQARHFLECAWEGLEHAGYDPARYGGIVGVFGGCGANLYLYRYMQELIESNSGSWHQTSLDGEKDFLTARVSYKLGLNGPSVTVQSACSTSLVAVHLACQSLLTFESDMALAGGVSIKPDQASGYLFEEGNILSRDGTCRAYDADATGAIGGNGCAVVVLKRLKDAVRDGDEIHAVIRGSAVNNDGADKAGFSAPGIKSQARLIASTLAFAELQPTDIGMIEGHGTGTVLGDAVELTALSEAFDTGHSAQKWCALGSIKSNVGHLDTAAGVTGLIKAVLCLKHQHFVPSLNYVRPNPVLDSPASPFFVNTEYTPWPSHGKPRRAGVSAMGMGGTNAHVILEEATPPAFRPATASPQVFLLSAHSEDALQQLCVELAHYLEQRLQLDLADVAYTLQMGRRRFAYRRAIVATTNEQLVQSLREPLSSASVSCDQHADRPVIFMFPGQGSQRSGVVQALYEAEPYFRARVDECAALFETMLGFDVRTFISTVGTADPADTIDRTLVTQPAVFTIGYSLARLWMHWGVVPSGLLGHSVGEYIAACVAGVLSLQDCVQLLARRAQLVNAQPAGAMLAVRLSAEESAALLSGTLSLAAINSPSQCVISGASEDIDEAARALAARGVAHHRLAVSHAFHSGLMDPVMPDLEQAAKNCRFAAPQLPYVSCLTGKLVGESDAGSPRFWARHLREPVNFQAALTTAAGSSAILLEVGSGQALCGLARQQFAASADYAYAGSLTNDGQSGRVELLAQLAHLWSCGASIDWKLFHQGLPRRRIGLVAYPFQRQRYWIKAAKREATSRDDTQIKRPGVHDETPVEKHADNVAVVDGWTELEASMVLFWQDVLGVEAVGRKDTFVSLGGDSLIAQRVIARINDEFGVKISLRVLISSTGTIEVLAQELVVQLASGLSETEMGEYLETLGSAQSDNESYVAE